ncbi:Uncharacterised protein [Mycobacterium tuberculosis]|nr:Uncharacterised protein [Mycobacterium tuberculosis]
MGENLQEVLRVRLHAFGRVQAANPVVFGNLGLAHDHAQRLLLEAFTVGVARIQGRVVHEGGSGANHDGVGAVTNQVPVNARGGAGNPLARAVSSRNEPVQGGRALRGDEGATLGGGNEPALVQQVGGVRELLHGVHGDALRAQVCGASGGVFGVVAVGVVEFADARLGDGVGAGAGASGMVAGLEAHVHAGAGEVGSRGTCGGECVGFGVRGACASVVAHVQQVPVTVGDDGTDERVRSANTLACRLQCQGHCLVVAEGLLGARQVQGACGGQPSKVTVLRSGVVQIVMRQVRAGGKGCGQVRARQHLLRGILRHLTHDPSARQLLQRSRRGTGSAPGSSAPPGCGCATRRRSRPG